MEDKIKIGVQIIGEDDAARETEKKKRESCRERNMRAKQEKEKGLK